MALFSPDGKWLTGLANGTVQIWQVPHGRQEGQLPVGDVNGMAFSSEAKTSGHGSGRQPGCYPTVQRALLVLEQPRWKSGGHGARKDTCNH